MTRQREATTLFPLLLTIGFIFITHQSFANNAAVGNANGLNTQRTNNNNRANTGGAGGGNQPRTTQGGRAQMHRTMQSANHFSNCARSMNLNPMDTFRRIQYKNALEDLSSNLKKLTQEAKSGNVTGQDIGQLQKQMTQALQDVSKDQKDLIKQVTEEKHDDDKTLVEEMREGRQMTSETNEVHEYTRNFIASRDEIREELAHPEKPPAPQAQSLDPITASSPVSAVVDGAPTTASAPTEELVAVTAFRQMDVLLSPNSLGKPEENLSLKKNPKEETGSQRVRLADVGFGSRLGDSSDEAPEKGKEGDKDAVLAGDLPMPISEEALVIPKAEPQGITVFDKPAGARKASEPLRAGFLSTGIWGNSSKSSTSRSRLSLDESGDSAWDDLIYTGGRFALLTIIVLASLSLLAFYLRSTLRAHRRDVDDSEHKILQFPKN